MRDNMVEERRNPVQFGFAWPMFLALALFIWLVGYSAPVPIDITQLEIMPLLGVLVFFCVMALVIERAVETFLVITLKPSEIDLANRMAAAKARDRVLVARMEEVIKMPFTSDERSDMLTTLAEGNPAQTALDVADVAALAARDKGRLSVLKSRIAVAVSLALAAALYLSGFGVLQGMLSADSAVSGLADRIVMAPLDALVTVLMLAGGAEGVHRVALRATSVTRRGVLRELT